MKVGTVRLAVAIVIGALCALSAPAQAQKAAVAAGVQVTRKTFPVPDNEAPFFNFADKTSAQRASDEAFVGSVLKQIPDRSKAAQATASAGWRTLIQNQDFATAAKRFNQAYLLDPTQSSIYHGFAAVSASRFRDYDYADELFRAAARMNAPSKSLDADHGRVMLMAGRPAQAKPLLEKAVRTEPDWAVPQVNLAWATFLTGDPKEACRLLAQPLRRDAESVAQDISALKQRAGCKP